jgi:hypothetical protein
MDDDCITHDPEKRVAIGEKILERAVKAGSELLIIFSFS